MYSCLHHFKCGIEFEFELEPFWWHSYSANTLTDVQIKYPDIDNKVGFKNNWLMNDGLLIKDFPARVYENELHVS